MTGEEKRRSPRVPADKGSQGQLKTTLGVTVLNFSSDGLLLELNSPLRPGSTYDLRVSICGVFLSTHVKITRCRAGADVPDGKGGHLLLYQAGAQFVDLGPAQVDSLRRALEKSSHASLHERPAEDVSSPRPGH